MASNRLEFPLSKSRLDGFESISVGEHIDGGRAVYRITS